MSISNLMMKGGLNIQVKNIVEQLTLLYPFMSLRNIVL